MKHYYKILTCLIICFSIALLSACSISKKTTEEKTKYCDKAFLDDLKKGLQARWDIPLEEDESNDEYYSNLKLCVKTELDYLSQYTSKTFEDSKLQEKAISYVNALNDSLSAMNYYYNDVLKYNELWSDAYNKRCRLISDFVNDYQFTVDDKYKSTLEELIDNSIAVKEQETLKNAVGEMLGNVNFKLESDSYGWKTYSAIIENTTGSDLGDFSISINLLDKDGVIVSSDYDFISNFSKGKKAKIEFSTDKEFESTELVGSYL